MIGFSTRKLSAIIATLLCSTWTSSVHASSQVEVIPRLPEGNRVTLSVKVLDKNNIPIDGLTAENFKVETAKVLTKDNQKETTNSAFNSIDNLKLIEPDSQTNLDLAYVVILLDMSGSMAELDSTGVRKLDGTVAAIRGFIKLARTSNLNLKIAVVPFGEDKQKSDCNYEVNSAEIGKKLLDVKDSVLDTLVDQLASRVPCSATNLYVPLEQVVKYLGTPNRFAKNSELPPRLSVILFSDGFDNASRDSNDPNSEAKRFAVLQNTLKANSEVTVHTLGYGERLSKLRSRAICTPALTDGENLVSNLLKNCKVANGRIDSLIVDEPRLKEIALTTGGISQFPENANQAARSLETFFKTLREYQLQYIEPTADAADQYQVKVQVTSEPRGINVAAKPQTIRLSNFVFYQLPLIPDRLFILILSLVGIGTIVQIFYNWSQHLKKRH